jgi:hypothetical protein
MEVSGQFHAYKIVVWKLERKELVGKPRCSCENNITIDLK